MIIKNENLRTLCSRMLWLLVIMFIYCLGNAIPLPFVEVTKSFNHVINHSPMGLLTLMGGSNYMQITLFSVGINPMMISMILIQVFSMTGALGFDALSPRQVDFFQQLMTLIFAAIQSTTVIWGMHLIPHHEILKIIAAVLIMSTGAMLVSWLGSMNSVKGIGGMMMLFLINITVGMLPRLSTAVHLIMKSNHPYLYLGGLLILALLLVYFWIAFSYAYYPLRLININFPSYDKPLTLPIGLNTGAMMMYMMGMSIIMLPMMIGQIFHIGWLNGAAFNVTFATIIGFLMFYLFSFMQFNPKDKAKMLRNQNNYILGLRPGRPTQKFLTKCLVWASLPGAIINTFQMVFGIVGIRYLGKVGAIASIPMVSVMVVMFMFGIKDSILTLLIPYEYEKIIKKEG